MVHVLENKLGLQMFLANLNTCFFSWFAKLDVNVRSIAEQELNDKRLWFKRGWHKHDTVMYLENKNNSSLKSWWHTFSWQFCFGYISILALSKAFPLRWWWKTTQIWSRIQINYEQFSPCRSIHRKGPKSCFSHCVSQCCNSGNVYLPICCRTKTNMDFTLICPPS